MKIRNLFFNGFGDVIQVLLFTVCFFVLCNRHRCDRVPGKHLGIALNTLRLDYHAGYADTDLPRDLPKT
jgi:hypothetical protein